MRKFILGIILGIAITFIPSAIAQTEKDGRWLLHYEVLDNQGVTVCEDPFISDSTKTIECE